MSKRLSHGYIAAFAACFLVLYGTCGCRSLAPGAAQSRKAHVAEPELSHEGHREPASEMITSATFDRCRLRLWHGSLRLNYDEIPLIIKERYSLKAGDKDYSHYTWPNVTTTLDNNCMSLVSSDKGGLLSRKITFSENGFDIDFRLVLKPDLRGKRSFYYDLQLDAEFFYGFEYRTGVVMRAVRKLGVQVPDDLSVVGFANLQLSKYLDPPLTTVEQPFADIGRVAVKKLIREIRSKRKPSLVEQMEEKLPVKLIVRESTTGQG